MPKKLPELDNLPIFDIEVEDDNQGIRFVSLVVDPAIEVKGMYFSKDEIKNFEFKAITEQKKVVGPAMIPNQKIYRNDEKGEYFVKFLPDTITKMVKSFNKDNNNRSLNFQHSNRMVDGYIEQNWIITDPIYDKSRTYGYNLPAGSWFIEVQIEDDEFWEKEVKEMGAYSFSIEGLMGISNPNYNFSYQFIDSLTDEEIFEIIKYLSIK